MNVVLGGGISGISAGYHLGQEGLEYVVCEKNSTWGGLCDNFTVGNGFRFDNFVHFSFTSNQYVRELFTKEAQEISHKPVSSNFNQGTWLRHPVQNNLALLSDEEKVKIIVDFIDKPVYEIPANYKEWLIAQFGHSFAENFPGKYTRKYWTVEADRLCTEWLGNRFSLPDIRDILKGSFKEQDQNFFYAKEMRYPEVGGYKNYLSFIARDTNIQTCKEVVSIDLKMKRVDYADGSFAHYEQLASSLPLPILVKLIKDVPQHVLDAGQKLLYTAGQLVSIGFNKPRIPNFIWFYIYDEEIFPARAYSPSMKSADNVPAGKSSIQFETYFSSEKQKPLSGDDLMEHVVKTGKKMNLFSEKDIEVIDYREMPFANVIFDHERRKQVEIIHQYLDEQKVVYFGRFGKWAYLWSDQSLISGKHAAEKLVANQSQR